MRHKRINFLLLLTIVICLSFLLYPFKAICADNGEEVKLLLYDAFEDKEKVNYRIVNIYSGLQKAEPSLEAAIKVYITSGNTIDSFDKAGIKLFKKTLITKVNNENNKMLQEAIGIKNADGIWGPGTWDRLFKYIESHNFSFLGLNNKSFFLIDVRGLGIEEELRNVRIPSWEQNALPASDIIHALPDILKEKIQLPRTGKSLTTVVGTKEENIKIEATALATKLDTLSKSITSLKSTIDEKFPQDLPKKIDDIKSEIESLKGKISEFSQNGGTTSFLKAGLLLGVVFLCIILLIFFAFRKHESNSRNNLSLYRDDIISKVSEQLDKGLRCISDLVGDTSTGNRKIESPLENQKIMMDALQQDINRLENKTDRLRKTLIIGEKEDPAVMTVLERVEEVRKGVLSLQEKVSPGNALSTQGKSNRTVSENAKASSRQRNGPLPKTEEKEDPMKIKFNLDDL